MSNFGAGVFLKEMLAGNQMRAFGVGPDFMPSRTHNVGREYLVLPAPPLRLNEWSEASDMQLLRIWNVIAGVSGFDDT